MLAAYPSNMSLVMEPLNTVVDHVGYFLPSVDVAADLVEEIGDSRFGILCDLYHQGIMGDDPVALISRHAGSFGYVHVAEFPGRNEPGVGSHDWADILRHLPEAGYDGWVGFEFSPKEDSDRALERIAEMWHRIGV
jgi:hydroxypyruvate isomerase